VRSVGQFVSFGEENSPRTSESAGCVYLTVMSSTGALLLQAFIFALFVIRVLNPTSKLSVPHKLCCEVRDGQYYLTTRIVHPQGHPVSNLSCTIFWVEPHTTAEGLRENRLHNLPLRYKPADIFYPTTLLVPLARSPLEEHADDLTRLPGHIVLTYTGFDETLRTSMFERITFMPRDIAFGQWRDVIPDHDSSHSPNMMAQTTAQLGVFGVIDAEPELTTRLASHFGHRVVDRHRNRRSSGDHSHPDHHADHDNHHDSERGGVPIVPHENNHDNHHHHKNHTAEHERTRASSQDDGAHAAPTIDLALSEAGEGLQQQQQQHEGTQLLSIEGAVSMAAARERASVALSLWAKQRERERTTSLPGPRSSTLLPVPGHRRMPSAGTVEGVGHRRMSSAGGVDHHGLASNSTRASLVVPPGMMRERTGSLVNSEL